MSNNLPQPDGFGTITLGICDWDVCFTLEVYHDYPTEHPYVVSTTFDPDIYDFSHSVPELEDIFASTDVNGNITLTGTYTAPFVEEDSFYVELEMCFVRIDSWISGPKDGRVLFSVYDMDCDPPLIEFFNQPNINVVPYADLRPVSETRLSTLLANGDIVYTSTGSLPDMLIDDELVIDIAGAAFWGSSSRLRNVFLLPGARIRVESLLPNQSEPSLGLIYVNLQTCPGQSLAEGIAVEPHATASAPFSKLSIANSIISDCRFAVNAQPGSSILLTNNQFVNNYIGVNLDMTGASSVPARVRIAEFAGNTFGTTAPLKAPYSGMPESVEERGLCGIRLFGYQDFNVFSNIGASPGGVNAFSSLANGILGFNSTGNIGNMSFSDMNSTATTPAYQHEGYGIYLASKKADWFNINFPFTTMTFDSCKTGIRAINYAGKVEGAEMTRVNIGIDWSNSHTRDVRLRDNTITARHFGIRSGLNEPLHPISAIVENEVTITGALAPGNNLTRGVEMNEIGFGYTPSGSTVPVRLEGWDVGSNIVALEQGGVGIGYRNGVSGTIHENIVTNQTQPADYMGILAEGIMGSDLTANTITQNAGGLGTSTAIQSSAGFANTCQCNCVDSTDIGLFFLDMADFSDAVRGNSMNTHCTGLQLNAGAYIGEQNHTGNIWDLSAITGNCLGGRNYSIPSLSRFFVNGTANPAFNPSVFPSNWFENVTGTAFAGCATCTFPPLTPPRIPESSAPTKLDEATATDKLFPELFEDETNWKGAFRLYRKMLRHPSIESYATEYADFKAAHDSLSTGRLAYIAEQRSTIFALSATEDSLLEVYRLAWHDGMADLLTLDSLRQSGDSSTLVSQYDSVVSLTTAVREQYVLYLDTLDMARRANIQSLLAQNAAISTAITPADNHKTVNAIVFGLLLNDSLQTGDLATLEAIAGMCPLEGGDAVYEARAIVVHTTGASYDDTDLCAVSAERSRAESTKPRTQMLSSCIPTRQPGC
ncbi:MAG: hypothetical protein IPM98_07720 [Lewinellaceae bacterium]|nr:hypothetical protein [Lewinellaceae bacterium]